MERDRSAGPGIHARDSEREVTGWRQAPKVQVRLVTLHLFRQKQ